MDVVMNSSITCTIIYIITAAFTQELNDVSTELRSEGQLTCAISDPLAVCRWFRNGILLKEDNSRTNQRVLHLPAISHEDEGEYECRCGNESTKAGVEVKGIKIL